MDPRLKRLVEELGQAINEAFTEVLNESEAIAEVVVKIRAEGHDVSMLLNTTAALIVRGEEPEKQRSHKLELKFDAQDIQFLKDMHIRVDR